MKIIENLQRDVQTHWEEKKSHESQGTIGRIQHKFDGEPRKNIK
jgi:hypothetical protein